MLLRGACGACGAAALVLAGSASAADGQGLSLQASALAAAPWGAGQGASARLAVEPRGRGLLGAGLEWRAALRLRWLDQDGQHQQHADLRELSIAWRQGAHALTLGAQQLNWGRMDILRVVDLVNPVDQNDLFHEELPEAKRALWMLNWEWQQGGHSSQLIVAPQPAVDRIAPRVLGLPARSITPAASWRNTTWAWRQGFEAGGWTVDAIALRGWQTAPELQPVLRDGMPALEGRPLRLTALGASADRPVGSLVLRLEGLLSRVRDEPAQAPARRVATLGAGVDLREGDWFAALQVVLLRPSSPAGLAAAQDNSFASLILQRKWLQDRLALRLSHLRESAQGSSWSSAQLSYELTAHHLLRLQADRFAGPATSTFGAFGGRSRLAASLRVNY